jgi:hypothetical protein
MLLMQWTIFLSDRGEKWEVRGERREAGVNQAENNKEGG